MIGNTRFRINSPKVIHETIDEETVIANLDTGNYYSLDKVGLEIWSLIEKMTPVSMIIEEFVHLYKSEREDITKAVHRLVNELQQEGLIIMDTSNAVEASAGYGIEDKTKSKEELQNFEVPVLFKYTDMQDLLLLDPIHDVDETGWPSAKNNLPASTR